MEALATTTITEEQNPLHKALQDQLRKLLEEPISIRTLLELQKTAALARKLLEIANPKARLARRLGGGYGSIISGANIGEGYDPEVDVEQSEGWGAAQGPYPLVPSPGSETFGASVIRELVPALKNQNKPRLHLADLVEALSIAQKRENTALASKIEAKIDALLNEQLEEEEEATDSKCKKCNNMPPMRGHEVCLMCFDKSAVEAQT